MYDPCDKAERIQSLEGGKGFQHLLDEAYAILGNPILMHDMEYKTIEYNKNVVTDDPIWNEYVSKGTVGYDWLDFFKNECFLEEAANAQRITVLTSEKLKYDRLFGKIFNKNNIQVGCAVLLACDKPFEEDDPVIFENLCAILSAELGRIEFYNDYGQAYFEKLIAELIAGVGDPALYAAHVESIYMHLKSNLYLAIADIGERAPEGVRLARFRDLLKQAQPEYMYAVYGDHILIIIGTDQRTLQIDRDMGRLNRLFRQHGICAGISGAFENLFELNRHYQDALDTLTRGLEIIGQRIFLHERLAP